MKVKTMTRKYKPSRSNRKRRSKARAKPQKKTSSPFLQDGTIRPHLFRIGVLFTALVIWKVFFEQPRAYCKDPLDPFCPDKYFSDNYTDSRHKFLSLSSTIRNAQTYNLPVYQLPDGSYLYTDITIINGNSTSDHLIMHLSGTHGVEGHAGSAIQIALLEYISNTTHNQPSSSLFSNYTFSNQFECDNAPPILMFVHALNPYGFHFRRRVNEHNVDLNRNYKTKAQWDDLVHKDHNAYGYEALSDWFNPQFDLQHMVDITSKLPSSKFMRGVSIAWYYWSFVFRGAYYLITVGQAAIFKAGITGQWYDEKGLQYVGEPFKVEASHQIVQDFLVNEFSGEWKEQMNKISFVDVHTGLGKYGVDTLIGEDRMSVETLKQLMPKHVEEGLVIDAEGFEDGAYEDVNGYTSGHVIRLVEATLNGKKMDNLNIVQEFGTYDQIRVFAGLRFENAMSNAYHKVKQQVEDMKLMDEVLDSSRKRFRKLFYVEAVDWKREILHRGFDLFAKIYDR